jgi:GNAT superfamily N-acetyltransferase
MQVEDSVSMTTTSSPPTVRRELRVGDTDAIVLLHRNVYGPEYGLGPAFSAMVARDVESARARGWPRRHGAVWLIDGPGEGELLGALALTHEKPPTLGHVHWFALMPQLRGLGLGRRLLGELLDTAREQGIERLELETVSMLTAAAHLYRSVGFQVIDSRESDDWDVPVTLQHYALGL